MYIIHIIHTMCIIQVHIIHTTYIIHIIKYIWRSGNPELRPAKSTARGALELPTDPHANHAGRPSQECRRLRSCSCASSSSPCPCEGKQLTGNLPNSNLDIDVYQVEHTSHQVLDKRRTRAGVLSNVKCSGVAGQEHATARRSSFQHRSSGAVHWSWGP